MAGEQGEFVEARLVRPPPAPVRARLLRRPRRQALALVGSALAAARTLPLPWTLLAAARLLRAAAATAPLVVAAGAFRQELAASGDYLVALLRTATSATVWLPVIGLVLATHLASWLVEIAGWAAGLPALHARLAGSNGAEAAAAGSVAPPVATGAAAGTTARAPGDASGCGQAPAPFAARFAALLQTGLLLLLIVIVFAAAIGPPIALATSTWLDAHQAGQGGALLASAALALVLAVALGCGLLLRLIAEAAVARVGAFGDRPLAGIYEGARLVLRRPVLFLGALYLLAIAGVLAGFAFAIPGLLAPPGPAGFLLRVLVEVATAAAGGLLALARLGVFVGGAGEQNPGPHPAGISAS